MKRQFRAYRDISDQAAKQTIGVAPIRFTIESAIFGLNIGLKSLIPTEERGKLCYAYIIADRQLKQ